MIMKKIPNLFCIGGSTEEDVDEKWDLITDGLSESKGTIISILAVQSKN